MISTAQERLAERRWLRVRGELGPQAARAIARRVLVQEHRAGASRRVARAIGC